MVERDPTEKLWRRLNLALFSPRGNESTLQGPHYKTQNPDLIEKTYKPGKITTGELSQSTYESLRTRFTHPLQAAQALINEAGDKLEGSYGERVRIEIGEKIYEMSKKAKCDGTGEARIHGDLISALADEYKIQPEHLGILVQLGEITQIAIDASDIPFPL
ncbi:MAG: hypothetical protein V1944_01850 [Candidatus Aenigmatarchaeota archaeon]